MRSRQVQRNCSQAQQLLASLNDRTVELKKVTIARVNDLLNDSNRANLAATLADTRGLIAETAVVRVNEVPPCRT